MSEEENVIEENVCFKKMLTQLSEKAKETNEFFKILINEVGNRIAWFEETHGISPSELKKKTLRGNIYHALLKFNELNEGGENENGPIEEGNLLEQFFEQFGDCYLDGLPDEEKAKLESVDWKDIEYPLEGFIEYMRIDGNLEVSIVPLDFTVKKETYRQKRHHN